MSNETQETPTFSVVQVRRVRAASAGEAVDIAEADLHTALSVDTGEAGHVAGGTIYGVVGEPNLEGWDGLTANQALLEAAMILLSVATQEGDDGTGGVQTLNELNAAIDLAADVAYTLNTKES
jgi:hypothetical protein